MEEIFSSTNVIEKKLDIVVENWFTFLAKFCHIFPPIDCHILVKV